MKQLNIKKEEEDVSQSLSRKKILAVASLGSPFDVGFPLHHHLT